MYLTSYNILVIINNVFKYFKANNPSDRDHSLFKRTAEATGSSLSTVKRIVQQKDGPKTPGKKRPNRKEEFSKLDEFDLGVKKEESYMDAMLETKHFP